MNRLEETLGPGVDTHKSPAPALFQKPVAGVVVVSFLDIKLQQLQRWRVEMCIFEWCEVWIGGLTEPSAGSRRWWSPGFSRVGKVACR